MKAEQKRLSDEQRDKLVDIIHELRVGGGLPMKGTLDMIESIVYPDQAEEEKMKELGKELSEIDMRLERQRLIGTIRPNKANFDYIAKSIHQKVNGTLAVDIDRILIEYGKLYTEYAQSKQLRAEAVGGNTIENAKKFINTEDIKTLGLARSMVAYAAQQVSIQTEAKDKEIANLISERNRLSKDITMLNRKVEDLENEIQEQSEY